MPAQLTDIGWPHVGLELCLQQGNLGGQPFQVGGDRCRFLQLREIAND